VTGIDKNASMDIVLKYFTDFTEKQLQQLRALGPLYNEWNEKINVISRKDMDGLYEKHVLHSLSIAALYEFRANTTVMDLGTGGGFPGIPLAIYFPETRFHLVDSVGKKIKVVEAIASAIDLQNVTTEHTRAESITNRKFDAVVSRAVAPLKELWHWSKPLLRRPAHPVLQREACGLICLKGGDLSSEIAESNCRPRITEIHSLFPEAYFEEKYVLQVM
jgi:16S rRNA (guanine527-N7)-methyltransferase